MHAPKLQHAPVIRVTATNENFTVEIGYQLMGEFYSSIRTCRVSGNRVLLEADKLKTWYHNSVANQATAALLEKEANRSSCNSSK